MPERNGPAEGCVAIVDIDRTLGDRVTLDSMDHQISSGLIKNRGLIKAADELKRAIEDMEAGMATGNYINPLSNLLRIHARALRGIPEKELETHEREFFRAYTAWYAYVGPLFEELTAHGYRCHILSAGGHVTVKAIADLFGAHGIFPSIYATSDDENGVENVLTGEIYWDLASPGRRAQAAVNAVGMYAYKGSLMFADSIADVAALSSVETPICVNPSSELKKVADVQEPRWVTIPGAELKKPWVPGDIMEILGKQALHQTITG
jgi:phosphoserine phosphatase